jgi:hypothetical protein
MSTILPVVLVRLADATCGSNDGINRRLSSRCRRRLSNTLWTVPVIVVGLAANSSSSEALLGSHSRGGTEEDD